MLESLKITNFALITELEISFGKGLNVLTGETGAGKSIVLDALNFVLGERADKDQIRTGETYTLVQAMFDLTYNNKAKQELDALGIQLDEPTLIVSRKLTLDGKNEVRLNGSIVNLNMLRTVTAHLVDIYGQHEHQSLLKPSNHIQLIDDLKSEQVRAFLGKISDEFAKLAEVKARLNLFGGTDDERARKLDLLEFQKNELTKASLKPSELEELQEKLKRMQNTEKVVSTTNVVDGLLDGAGDGALAKLYQASKQLSALSVVDESFGILAERLNVAHIEVDDIASTLQQKLTEYDFSETEFTKIDSRVDFLKTIARKYGGNIESAIAELDKITAQIEELSQSGELIAKLNAEIVSIENSVKAICAELSTLRKQIAEELEGRLNPEFQELGMKNAKFKVEHRQLVNYTHTGQDDIEFMFSANLGEPLKQLSKVISGGEMSRFMLAFKVVVGSADEISTLVFDEIDSGISGAIGQTVAEKMAHIAKSTQIIAVSHLPQIAAMADVQFLITKSSAGGKTTSTVLKLDKAARIAEVARLAGGSETSASATQHAAELISAADKIKASF